MKILIDARLYGLENAGLGRYLINLISNLVRIDDHNSYTILLKSNYFDRLQLPASWQKVEANFGHYSWEEQIKLPILINKFDPDLVHFPHFNVPLFYSRPYVATIHDMLMHNQKGKQATTLSTLEYNIKRLGYRIVFDRAVHKSIRLIVPSYTVKQELESFYHLESNKIAVTYEGIESPKFSPHSKYKLSKPYFIYAGNAYPHKNLENAIRAVVQLNEEVNLIIVSARNIFVERLKKLITKNGWQKRIILLGFVPDDELASLFRKSLGFIFPSLSEGFGLPGLEAMAAGTVCLCSDIPVFKEIYKKDVIYFDPYNITSIKESLDMVIKMNKEEREKLIVSGKALAKTYSWDKMARQTLDVYESCSRL
jgi:glycosyltransferase involved in cell wall biosynthesis